MNQVITYELIDENEKSIANTSTPYQIREGDIVDVGKGVYVVKSVVIRAIKANVLIQLMVKEAKNHL